MLKDKRYIFISLIAMALFSAPLRAEALTSEELNTPLVTMDQSQNTVNLGMYKGKVILLDFWASWCVPCRASFPFYQNLYNKYASKGFMIIGVNGEDDLNEARKFLQTYQPSFLIVRDEGNMLAKQFNPPKMPTSYLIDRSGNIVHVHAAFVAGDDAKIEAAVKAALGK